MKRARLERRLLDLQGQIASARERAAVLEEQCSNWHEMYDDARIRSLVAETPVAERESADMARQVQIADAALHRLYADIDELVASRDRLFENWNPEAVL